MDLKSSILLDYYKYEINYKYDFSTQILMRSDSKLLAKALNKKIKSNVLQHSDVYVSVTGQILNQGNIFI